MEEIFKDIPGFEGKYQASNLGNIKSLNYKRSGKEGILQMSITKWYKFLSLSIKSKVKVYNTHSLVMLTFIGERPTEENGQKYDINHKNGIKTDNRLENLEYCTKRENQQHKYRVLGYKAPSGKENHMFGRCGGLNHRSKKINQYDLNGEFIKTWDCGMDIQRELGLRAYGIYKCCRGIYKTSHGFKWDFNLNK